MTADLSGAVVMVAALRDGKAAATAGQPATSCPFSPTAEDAQTRARARMWLRGYDRARPLQVDYSG